MHCLAICLYTVSTYCKYLDRMTVTLNMPGGHQAARLPLLGLFGASLAIERILLTHLHAFVDLDPAGDVISLSICVMVIQSKLLLAIQTSWSVSCALHSV